MIVVFRNFFRNKMVNLSAKSVRHFMPGVTVYCLSLYKQSEEEYNTQEPLLDYIQEFKHQTQYISSNTTYDHVDSTKTSGYQNGDNAKYFIEGYNIIMDRFKDTSEKILILAEDHFFTKGLVLHELYHTDFDLAYAPWDEDLDANASVLCLRPKLVSHLFPMTPEHIPIERHLKDHLITKVKNRYKIEHRRHADYFGDGMYTNSSHDIETKLREANIL